MATYDLDQTQLNDILNSASSSPLAASTDTAIINALRGSGFYPKPGLELVTDVQSDSALTNVDLQTAISGGVGLYLEEGSNTSVNITSSFGSVVAAGDGANVELNDIAGNDTLVGGAGPDTLIGGGMSYLLAAGGKTQLTGGANSAASDTLQGGTGSDTMTVSAGNNTIIGGKGFDTITAGVGNDTIYGTSGTDSITTVSGGRTTIYTGSGQETINANLGADTIYVGYNSPYGTGVGGADTINAGGTANTTINVDTNYVQNVSSPTTAPDGNTLIVFSNGGVTTDIEIKGHATVNYLNKTIDT